MHIGRVQSLSRFSLRDSTGTSRCTSTRREAGDEGAPDLPPEHPNIL